ncbi:MAG TPA: ribonuclease E/G [Deltaproteobacteria bacterium]|nr:ribonuclease E/G [Deltaproteobacteria bacterium]HPR53574.1 ribonuclease E/G [Deltaproteobacteria bacterium]HXK47635.1 ribonuclease E/G [Deltaproteobacteria bacterium]
MKKMLINAVHPEEIRVAVVDEGVLTEYHMESALKEQLRGNVYKARISKVEHSLNAAFVDYGREKHGLLPAGDINPAVVPDVKNGSPVMQSLRKGMEILVQVVREEKGAKGALLTTEISLPGRFLVLLPQQDMAGVSRKIEDEKQRKRLREIIDQIKPPEGMGIIVRTAGMDKTKTELAKDMTYLLRLWKSIQDQFKKTDCPNIIYKEGDIIIRTIRDYLTTDTTEILIDDDETVKRAATFMKTFMPKQKDIIKTYRQNKPLFTKFELEQQIEGIYDKKVKLRSGGSIIIEPTEAMVVIDVNSGQSTNTKSIEATAFETNREAAAEIARQLVLRDLGGLIAIDFIDMRSKENIRGVEKALREGLKNDRAHVVIGKISKFGIMELSRERLSPPLVEKSHVQCPLCEGFGLIRSVESAAFMALREIQLYLTRNNTSRIKVSMTRDVGLYVLNQQKRHLMRLEQDFNTEILISTVHTLKVGQIRIEAAE